MNGEILPTLLTLDEVAERLGVGRRTVNAWIAAQRIRVVQLGPRTPRVAEADLAAFIDQARRDQSPTEASELSNGRPG